VLPFIQCLYDGIELFIICGVFLFCLFQLIAEIFNRPVFLAQDCSYGKPTCITFYLECFLKIWQHQDWLLYNLSSQQIETLLSLFHPVKIFMSFLHYIHHCCTNSTEILDEFSVETSQSMKNPHLKYIPQ
jgi:hypothetical protein